MRGGGRRIAVLPARRPAETGGIAGATTLLIVRAVGVKDPDVIVALGAVVGFVPAGITWVVATVRKSPAS